jgi:peptidoglycan/LPS O-acetylase OafA/YrhL
LATTQQRTRLDALTSLRWIAATVVFGRHAYYLTKLGDVDGVERLARQGAVGVSFFFILSGFVLTWSHRDSDRPQAFWRRRFARIVPAYLVVWVVSLAVKAYAGKHIGPEVLPSAALVQAWVPKASVYYAVNSVNWSLSVEVFFYAIFPFIIGPLLGLDVQRRRLVLAACLAVPFAVAAILTPEPGSTGFWILYICPVTRLAEFIVGICIASEVRAGTWPRLRLGYVGGVAAAAYIAAGYVAEPYMWVAVTVAPFALFIAATAQHDLRNGLGALRAPWLVWLGVVSYAFYLTHTVAIEALDHVVGRTWLVPAAALPLALVSAAIVHRVVERPAEARLRGAPLRSSYQ